MALSLCDAYAMFTGGVRYLSIVPLKIPASCRVGTPVYWWDKKIVLSSYPRQSLVACPLSPLSATVILVRRRGLLSVTIVASRPSHPPSPRPSRPQPLSPQPQPSMPLRHHIASLVCRPPPPNQRLLGKIQFTQTSRGWTDASEGPDIHIGILAVN